MSQDRQLQTPEQTVVTQSEKLVFKPDPASILRLAWSQSGKYTSQVEEQVTAQNAELSFKSIKELLLKDNDPVLAKYAFSIESSLLGCSRTFAMIVRHRDYLFATVDERKTNELDMYKSLQSFSAKLQSIFPRLAGIAIAGTTLPLAVNQALVLLFPKMAPIPGEVMTLAITGFGALGYFIAEIGSSRIANKKMIETKQKYELQKEQIYQEFLQRSKLALTYLLNDIISSYKKIVDSNYNLTEEEKSTLIDNCIASAMPLKKQGK